MGARARAVQANLGLASLPCIRGPVMAVPALAEGHGMGETQPPDPGQLDEVVREVVGDTKLRAEEAAYLKAHALKKPLRVPDIWALGVGVVITGAYFGWN